MKSYNDGKVIVMGITELKAVVDLNYLRQSSSGPTHLLAPKISRTDPPVFLSFYWKYLEGSIVDLGKFPGIDRRNISILLSVRIVLTKLLSKQS